MMTDLKAPFPWFGSKNEIMPLVWNYIGDPMNLVDPFCGSGSTIWTRPQWQQHKKRFTGKPYRTETINDADAYLTNFFRATKIDPLKVAEYADEPVDEAQLHANHAWLVGYVPQPDTIPLQYLGDPSHEEAYRSGWTDSYKPFDPNAFRERLMADPFYCDLKIAGMWVHGLCAWIGSGWCDLQRYSNGVRPSRQRPHLRPHQGIFSHRKPPHQTPHLAHSGRGVHAVRRKPSKQMPRTFRGGSGIHATRYKIEGNSLQEFFNLLGERLRNARIICGDWKRVLTPSVTHYIGLTGVILDPPYDGDRVKDLYPVDDPHLSGDGRTISEDVREWAIENGDNKNLRIALFGFEEEHGPFMPDTWNMVSWSTRGGYGNQRKGDVNENRHRERVWFSPHCLDADDDTQLQLL